VDLEHGREWSAAARLVEPRQPRLAAVALVDEVLDQEFVLLVWFLLLAGLGVLLRLRQNRPGHHGDAERRTARPQ